MNNQIATISVLYEGSVYTSEWTQDSPLSLREAIIEACEDVRALDSKEVMTVSVELVEYSNNKYYFDPNNGETTPDLQEAHFVEDFVVTYNPEAPHLTFKR